MSYFFFRLLKLNTFEIRIQTIYKLIILVAGNTITIMNDSYCFFWPDQPSRCRNILILQYLFSIISFVFLFCVIGIIIMSKLYKMFVQRLILIMCFCSLVNTAMFFINVDKANVAVCRIQGFFNQFMSWTELLWVCVITGNIFSTIHGYQMKHHEKKIHLIVWLTSLFWSVIPLFGMNYGPAGSWCWVKRENTSMRFGVWYIPMIIIVFVMLVLCVYLICCPSSSDKEYVHANSVFAQQQRQSLRQSEVRPLVAYPIIYLLLNMPMLIYRIDDAIHPKLVPDYTLLILSVIATPLVGTFNAIAFCLIEDTLKDSCTIAALKNMLFCRGETTRIVHNYEVVDNENDKTETPTNRNYETV